MIITIITITKEEKSFNKRVNNPTVKSLANLHGPSIIAWIFVTSSSLMIILIPSKGLRIKSCSSLVTCLITCGDRFSTFDVP